MNRNNGQGRTTGCWIPGLTAEQCEGTGMPTGRRLVRVLRARGTPPRTRCTALHRLQHLRNEGLVLNEMLRSGIAGCTAVTLDEIYGGRAAASSDPTDQQRVFELYLDLVTEGSSPEDLSNQVRIAILDPRQYGSGLVVDGVDVPAAKLAVESGGLDQAIVSIEDREHVEELARADRPGRVAARLRRWSPRFSREAFERTFRQNLARVVGDLPPLGVAFDGWDSGTSRQRALRLIRDRSGIERCPECLTGLEDLTAVPFVHVEPNQGEARIVAGWMAGCESCCSVVGVAVVNEEQIADPRGSLQGGSSCS